MVRLARRRRGVRPRAGSEFVRAQAGRDLLVRERWARVMGKARRGTIAGGQLPEERSVKDHHSLSPASEAVQDALVENDVLRRR